MDNLPDIDPESGKVVTTVRGDIKLEKVSFFYQMRPDNKVLKDLDLHIKAGTTCALVGKSGGGKSTLVHLLMRFYDPKGGRILLDGVPFTDLNLRTLHKNMAIVAQDTQLFAGTIEENICYGMYTTRTHTHHTIYIKMQKREKERSADRHSRMKALVTEQ
jgi:ABC-type multidrug transport system fused ATPase/permease subunit